MNADEARYVMTQLGASRFKVNGKGFMTNCPLAPSQHQSGVDKNPSLQVFCDKDPTVCFCFSCKFRGVLYKLASVCGASTSLLEYIDGAEGNDIYKRAKHLPDYDNIPNSFKYVNKQVILKNRELMNEAFKAGGWYFYGRPSLKELQRVSEEEKDRLNRWINQPHPPYLAQRGILQETINQWGIGYDPEGIVGKRQTKTKNGEWAKYIFSNGERIVFTIKNDRGEIVGWSKRTIHAAISKRFYKKAYQDQDVFVVRGDPKYYHMPGFKKDNYFYGMDKINLEASKTAVIVEGFMDVLSLYQAGVPNALACMGSSISDTQIRFLIDKFDKVCIFPDGDKAGLILAEQAFGMLSPYMTVKICGWIDGKDPGDFKDINDIKGLLAHNSKISIRNK